MKSQGGQCTVLLGPSASGGGLWGHNAYHINCNDSPPHVAGEAGTYSSVTTGVAVVETPGEAGRLGLLYGCWSGRLGAGGMGLLTITRPQGTRTLTKITDESGPIFAGTLFVTDENFCGIETSTSTTAQTTSPTGSVPQSVTADMGRFIVTVIWGVMTKKFLCIS